MKRIENITVTKGRFNLCDLNEERLSIHFHLIGFDDFEGKINDGSQYLNLEGQLDDEMFFNDTLLSAEPIDVIEGIRYLILITKKYWTSDKDKKRFEEFIDSISDEELILLIEDMCVKRINKRLLNIEKSIEKLNKEKERLVCLSKGTHNKGYEVNPK